MHTFIWSNPRNLLPIMHENEAINHTLILAQGSRLVASTWALRLAAWTEPWTRPERPEWAWTVTGASSGDSASVSAGTPHTASPAGQTTPPGRGKVVTTPTTTASTAWLAPEERGRAYTSSRLYLPTLSVLSKRMKLPTDRSPPLDFQRFPRWIEIP